MQELRFLEGAASEQATQSLSCVVKGIRSLVRVMMHPVESGNGMVTWRSERLH